MSDEPRPVLRWRGLEIVPDVYCATWQTTPHKGWRGFLIYRLPYFLCLPKRWFKPEKKDRVVYWLPDGRAIVSYETYAYMLELTEGIRHADDAVSRHQTQFALGKVLLPKLHGDE